MCAPGTVEAVRRRADEEGVRFDRRTALMAGAGAAVAAAFPSRLLAGTRRANRLQDLTHVYSETFPLFLGAPIPTERSVVVTVPANGFYAQKWSFWEHSGTHMDAPAHFIANGRKSPEITLEELIVPIVVVDISSKIPANADAMVMPADLVAFERGHGRIPRGALVAMYSGWETRAGSVAAYRNVGPDGFQHFPGFSKAAIEWLVAERSITAIGVDTMSLDPGASTTFDAHLTLLGANRYGLENLRNLGTIPPRGATAYVGLIPWKEGSGGPARVIAAW
jgi:kynurenine formamidase